MVNSLTKKTLQDLSQACYELALERATWLDVGAAFGYPRKKLVRALMETPNTLLSQYNRSSLPKSSGETIYPEG